jgi:hypothetical protein
LFPTRFAGIGITDKASLQAHEACPEHIPSLLTEVVLDKFLKSPRRPVQHMEYGPEAEQVSILTVGQRISTTLWFADLGLVSSLVVVWLVVEDEALDGDNNLEEA